MRVPQDIRNRVFSHFGEGETPEDIVDLMGFSPSQVVSILRDISSPEGQNSLSYLLVAKFGDMKDYADLIEAKTMLVQQGVPAKYALNIVTDILQFCQRTGLNPDQFLPSFGIFCRYAITGISTYEDLQKKITQTDRCVRFLVEDVTTLEEQNESLKNKSVQRYNLGMG